MMKTICLSFIQKQTPEINVENFDISNQAVMITVLGSLSNKNSNGNENISLCSKSFCWVSEQRRLRKGSFGFDCARNDMAAKNERGGRESGMKETLADKPLNFENLRLPAKAVPDWLG